MTDKKNVDNISLNKEINRRLTFDLKYFDKKNIYELAHYGFYSFILPNIIKCYFCDCVINFKKDDKRTNILLQHIYYNIKCPFFSIKDSEINIPIYNTQYLETLSIYNNIVYSLTYETIYSKNIRLNSFVNWPETLKQKPIDLANAGFIYLGFSDVVRCYTCGLILHKWVFEDNPMEQHALWNNKCNFLKRNKTEVPN